MSLFAELYASFFRCCGFIKPPEIEMVEINDEIYVNNGNFQERLKDLKYFNHYCRSRAILLSQLLFPISLALFCFGLSTERPLVFISSIVYFIACVIHLGILYLHPKTFFWIYGIVQSVFLISNVFVLLYWLSLILSAVHFWTTICTILSALSLYMLALVAYYVCRIQTIYHYIPKKYHKFLF